MSGNIMTPNMVWGDFEVNKNPDTESVKTNEVNGVLVEKLYIEGRPTDSGIVKIFGVMARKNIGEKQPALLVVGDLKEKNYEGVAVEFANKGYCTLVVDVAGDDGTAKEFTVYPEDINYANYKVSENSLFSVSTNAKNTCFYEWGAVCRNAYSYLRSLNFITEIGALGVSYTGSAVWYLAANEKISAAAFCLNAGWLSYRNEFKFAKQQNNLSDETLNYIAGLDPQSYATAVNCPVIILSPTNSKKFDCDRASDTAIRIPEKFFRAVNYSVGYNNVIDTDSFSDVELFFEKFLMKKEITLPEEPEIKCKLESGKIEIETSVDKDGLKSVEMYVSEGVLNPRIRSWKKIDAIKTVNGVYKYEYLPYQKSEFAFFFSKAKYENGFTLCSNIIAKEFKETEVSPSHKNGIMYSSREKYSEDSFVPENPANGSFTKYVSSGKHDQKLKKGPNGIEGVIVGDGVLNYRLNGVSHAPEEESMLIFYAFKKEEGELTVKLVADKNGVKTEYCSTVKIAGGNIWYNFGLEKNKFKTAEGITLKNYKDVVTLSFSGDDGILINNVLWV